MSQSTVFIVWLAVISPYFWLSNGTPLTPITGAFALLQLETKVIPELDYNMPYTRYVDNILLGIPDNKIDHTLHKFTEFHLGINFTHENPKDNSIYFLNIIFKLHVICTKKI